MSNITRIGFTGAIGSYSEAAVRALYATHSDFRGKTLETVAFASNSALLEAVCACEVDQAVTAIENSRSGTLHEFLSLFIDSRRSPALRIAAEFIYHEPHQLLGLPGATTSAARQVISHEHVLRQCDAFINDVLPQRCSTTGRIICQRVLVSSTGEAAECVREQNDSSIVCVAGHTAALAYGLVPVGIDTGSYQPSVPDRIETLPESTFTRFWLLARESVVRPVERHQEPKTSLALRTQNRPGELHRVLGCFATRGINVFKIESRPQTSSIQQAHAAWSYDMYIDFQGAPSTDAAVARALMNVQEFATEVVVLGSYPRYLLDNPTRTPPFGL